MRTFSVKLLFEEFVVNDSLPSPWGLFAISGKESIIGGHGMTFHFSPSQDGLQPVGHSG